MLGPATQSVAGSGANETIKATAVLAGARVSGLGSNSTLEITSGGTVTLNAATTVTTVKLDAASMLSLNGMQFIAANGSTGADTIVAGASNQILTGGAGADTSIGYSGGNTVVKATSGATKVAFTMTGSFSSAGFHLASDGLGRRLSPIAERCAFMTDCLSKICMSG